MAGFDETFDWVVVGSGAGSMSSALVMRKAGKSVVILEKTKFVGGTTAKSGGVMWIPNNRFIRAAEPDESAEKAIAYLDAVCGDSPDTPGTSRDKRRAYVNEAPKMLDFIIEQGIEMERTAEYWPDYYDELPGGCKTSRCVTAKYFNTKELRPLWQPRLRPGFLPFPAKLDEGMRTAFKNKSWKLKALYAKIAVKFVLGRLTGKSYTAAGAALQGRMLEAALRAGTDIRVESPVSELVVEDGKVTGVVTEKGDKPWRIGARLGVLVNAGGFAQNQAMRDKYMPGTRAEWSNTPEGDTGEMHRELERIGGVLAQMDQMVGYQTTRSPSFATDYVKPPGQSLTGRPGARSSTSAMPRITRWPAAGSARRASQRTSSKAAISSRPIRSRGWPFRSVPTPRCYAPPSIAGTALSTRAWMRISAAARANTTSGSAIPFMGPTPRWAASTRRRTMRWT